MEQLGNSDPVWPPFSHVPKLRRLPVVLAVAVLAGCGTTRVTDSQRTATEQLLVSSAVDEAVSEINVRPLAGKAVFLDVQYLDGTVDKGYVISSLRQHLLANGCLLQEDRSKATYVVEARAGGVGTDHHEVLVGVPQMNLPVMMPGQPSMIPEIPFAKKIDQKGVAKVAVFAYNRLTGRPVLQSGIIQKHASSRDLWLLGSGPFRRGTLAQRTEFAGENVTFPFLLEGREQDVGPLPTGVAVTQAAYWAEPAPTGDLRRAGYVQLLAPVGAR
jgi:hypothetical protein